MNEHELQQVWAKTFAAFVRANKSRDYHHIDYLLRHAKEAADYAVACIRNW